MRAFLLNYLGKATVKLLVGVLVAASVQVSSGDQIPSLLPLAPSSQGPDWQLGPTTAKLGEYAGIEVPEGYRFTDAKGARTLLQRMGNPVPRSLVGLLAPNTGKWWVVLEFKEVGYVKDVDRNSRIDAPIVLKALRERIQRQNNDRARLGAPPISSVEWAAQPSFDFNRYILEWAVRAQAGPQGVVNYTVRMLGRQGVLDATAVQSEQGSSETIPIKDLMQNVYFNPGERYIDYQRGDRLAKVGLEDLVIGLDDENDTSGLVKVGLWVGAVFLACALATIGVILVRRKIRHHEFADAVAVLRGRSPSYHPPPPPQKNGARAAGVKSKGEVVRNGADDAHRRKTFNYYRFYSDMMSQVSSGSSYPGSPINGKSAPRDTDARLARPDARVSDVILRANQELIANQTNLIEEQKRLLQEQSKLIEEKSKLIREKNQLLDKQTELFERDLL